MIRYMLDTNMVSHIIRQNPNAISRLLQIPIHQLCISAITEAELRYGVAKRPNAVKLKKLVDEFLLRIDVLPFDSHIAIYYGKFKSQVEQDGKSLSPLDMQIAAHAYAVDAILVTNDQAFKKISQLNIEDWLSPKDDIIKIKD